jgi:Brp/Blh family beta-carotene 15,15'-monooxygenase
MQRPWTRQFAAFALLVGLAALAGLYWAEQQWPQLGLWLFIILSLTLGMGHGALDAALLLGQFKPARKALSYAVIYLVITVAAAVLLSLSIAWALIILLAMSVWHFGETYAPYPPLRLAVGGVSVMAPMLLHSPAIDTLLTALVAADASWVATVWRALAWCWLAGACMALWWRGRTSRTPSDRSARDALVEIALVLALFTALSPLLAFALYFGIYHCISHILRVQRAVAKHRGSARAGMPWAVLASAALTALLLAVLWLNFPTATKLAQSLSAHMLQWLVVALAAVTLPHLVLVAYSHRWLGR